MGLLGRLEEWVQLGLLDPLGQQGLKVQQGEMVELDLMDILVGEVRVVRLAQLEEMVLLVGGVDMEIVGQLV